MLLVLHPQNPHPGRLQKAVQVLQQGGLVIYPTDTVYALGCAWSHKKACERLAQLKGTSLEKARFACIAANIADVLGTWTLPVDTPTYKLLRRILPGPYTVVLNASHQVPPHLRSAQRHIGLRVVDHPITAGLVQELGQPIVTTSLHRDDDDFLEYPTDPEYIHDVWGKRVDLVIDGGAGGLVPSTVLDLTGGLENLQVLRQGLGDVELLGR